MNYSDITLICCSYETPMILEGMLKSFKFYHSTLKSMNCIIMENSISDTTKKLLDSYNIKYIFTKQGTHSITLDKALKLCNTKYAFVVDSDIIFTKSTEKLLNYCIKNEYAISGYMTFFRAGYNIYSRINPWFMFIDMDQINKHKIVFHDQKRIDKTKSNNLFNNVPLSKKLKTFMYDVGSTFYEDIVKADLKIGLIPTITTYFHHYEGLSWRKESNDKILINEYNSEIEKYNVEIEKYKEIDIKDFYIMDIKNGI